MKQFLPALAAVSGACGLVAAPAAALELGDLKVESKLGQPLRASIAYALQPDEQLHAYCIFLQPGNPGSALPNVSRAQISVTSNAIQLTGNTPIREPMLGMRLSVDCPYTAKLLREYTMFMDINPLASVGTANQSVAASVTPSSRTDERRVVTPRRTNRAAAINPMPLSGNNRYQVQPGDSLSGIVARISDRPRGLWPAVDAIFAANPQAFIDGDINLIKAGAWLEIPDLYEALGAAPSGTVAKSAGDAPAQSGQPAAVYEGFESQAAIGEGVVFGVSSNVAHPAAAPDVTGARAEPRAAELPVEKNTGRAKDALRPGDVIIDSDNPFVADAEPVPAQVTNNPTTVIIPDTRIDQALNPPAAVATRADGGGSWARLAWLGGAGLAVFLGLLLFGRSLRDRFGSAPVGEPTSAANQRRRDDADPSSSAAGIDYDLDAIPETASSMSLDADLGLGTGFHGDADIDLAQDFGFSASEDFAADFDLDLTSAATRESEQQPTDVIPPHRSIESSILESEIPPSDDDDYDVSMIVDATRQPIVDSHLTAKDLKAVAIGSADDDDDSEEYTLSREVDYKILEQDYQEEFTTTQALNAEIARAALELAESVAQKDAADETAEMPGRPRRADTSDRTAKLPAKSAKRKSAKRKPARNDTEITAEITANLVGHGDAVNDDLISDLDDTGVNQDMTAELRDSDYEVTVEMDIEGGRIDTKKSRAS